MPPIRSYKVTRLVTNIVQSGEPSKRESASANVAWTEALKSMFRTSEILQSTDYKVVLKIKLYLRVDTLELNSRLTLLF